MYNLTQEEVPAIEEVTEERLVTPAIEEVLDNDGIVTTEAQEAVYETVVVIEAKEATTKTVYNKLEEFNHNCPYDENERGYVSLYNSLTEKFGGIKV